MAVRKTSMGQNSIYITYSFWSKLILMEAVPYCVILILNAIIVCKICESVRFRKRFANNRQRQEPNEYTNNRDGAPALPAITEHGERRQSSPILKNNTIDQANVCFLSSTNLTNNSRLNSSSSTPSQVHQTSSLHSFSHTFISFMYHSTVEPSTWILLLDG